MNRFKYLNIFNLQFQVTFAAFFISIFVSIALCITLEFPFTALLKELIESNRKSETQTKVKEQEDVELTPNKNITKAG